MYNSYSINDFIVEAKFKTEFHINRLEEMPVLPPEIKSPHKHEFYEVLLIKNGSTLQNVDYQEFKIETATVFFISQGQVHFWGRTNTDQIEGYRLMFTEDFFLQNHIDKNFLFELVFLDNMYFYPSLNLSNTSNLHQIYSYFDLMYEESNRTDANPKALQSLFYLALSEIQRIAAKQVSAKVLNKQISVFKQFIELLEKNYQRHLSINDYADKLCISVKQLNRSLASITNQNASDIIKNRLLLEAKRLLTCTDLNVKQVSFELGFEDPAYFARFFRKEMTQSPLEFKNTSSELYHKRS
jgi:AraC family transcriptional regulator, transcriptional activator of pobA